MPQFAKRRTQPLRADSYRRLARLVRTYADRLELAAERADPVQRKSITDSLNSLHHLALHYWHRHHGRNPGIERAEEFQRRLDADVVREQAEEARKRMQDER